MRRFGVKRCWCGLLVLARAAIGEREARVDYSDGLNASTGAGRHRNPRANTNNPHQHLLLLLLLSLTACTPPTPLPHEAYIWQRQWTPAVVGAVQTQAGQFSGWRLLALQVVGERMIEVAPDLVALKATRLPLRMVVRIEGARLRPAAGALAMRIGELRQRWLAAGLRIDGIEIDHDCASAALGEYAQWLRDLRAALPDTGLWSITALPAWMESPDLEALREAVDESVLQVHAVDRPQTGLFDKTGAWYWIFDWARRSPQPFRVALPAYGVRVGVDGGGKVRAVDAEGIERVGPGGSELRADPREVAALIETIAEETPAGMRGWVWFRLPVAGDARGWSAPTLAAAIAGEPLQAEFSVQVTLAANGASDLVLRNDGNLDSPLPAIDLPAHCRLGDALGRYRMDDAAAGLRLVPADDAWLPAGGRLVVGWTRCAQPLEPRWSIQ